MSSMATADTGVAIDKFIAKSKQIEVSRDEYMREESEDWDNMASGIDPNDYQPKDVPLPSLPPVIAGPGVDTGSIPNPFTSSSSRKKDTEDELAVPGVCGLVNIGNTCYMNAGLQCIRNVPKIAQFYLGDDVPLPAVPNTNNEGGEEKEAINGDDSMVDHPVDNIKPNVISLSQGHMSARFSSLMKKIWAGQFSSIVPHNFKTTLGIIHSQFGGFRQQDCQEFLALLLDSLHEDHKNMNGQQQQQQKQQQSVITNTFQGQLRSEVTCCTCDHVSTKFDPFVYLSLPIPHSNERQIDVYWSCIANGRRDVIRMLLTVPCVSTIEDMKRVLCDILDRHVDPNDITIAHVKDFSIEFTLANSLSVKKVNDKDYQVYIFHTQPILDGHDEDHVPMETDHVEDDEMPAKIARSEPEPGGPSTPRRVVVMEWHSCVICLEEMVDSNLLTHKSCGATLCSMCLEGSRSHSANESGHMPCPVCQAMISPELDFVPLCTSDNDQEDNSTVKYLQLAVLYRNQESDNWSLVGHPCILNMPSNGSVELYHNILSQLVPSHIHGWSLALTDGKGRYCSRCMFGSKCTGCVLDHERSNEEVSMKPGDFLSISFTGLSCDMIDELNKIQSHPSLQHRWPSTVSLNDCLNLFSQKEVLGSDNPWWCPVCKSNQLARRELIIHRLPRTLIVHLKRFLYHANMANKVDMGVAFPLSLSISAPPSFLSLIGCVCHFGSINCGHYTSYSVNPSTNKWYYYNDESISESTPSDGDKESVYILFYQQETTDSAGLNLPAERGGAYPSEEEELKQLEPLLRVMKPKPLPPPPPPLSSVKKSSSTGNLNDSGSGDVNDIQLQQQLAASLGIDAPVTNNNNNDAFNPSLPPLLSKSSSNPSLNVTSSNGAAGDVILKSVHLKYFDA